MINFLFSILLGILLQSPSAIFLSGVSSAEEMDSETIERFERFQRNPLKINLAGKSQLVSSGLLSPYQAASILDYIAHNGEILSFSELALVDGIGEKTASALKEFVSLESSTPPGKRRFESKLKGSGTLRYGSSSYLGKIHMEYSDVTELNLSSKKSVPFRGSAAYYGKSTLGKIVAGSFNARFGQGLLLWSGMSMSGLSTTDAFCKKSTGISASTSTSSDNVFTGLAGDFNFGRWTLSTLLPAELPSSESSAWGLYPGANLTFTSRRFQGSVSAVGGGGRDKKGQPLREALASVDFRSRLGKTDIFGEFAWDFFASAPAATLGIRRDPQYQVNWSVLGRYYSPSYTGKWAAGVRSSTKTSDEAGISAGAKIKWVDTTLDCAFHPSKQTSQAKFLLTAAPVIDLRTGKLKIFTDDSPDSREIIPSLRFSERWRPKDNYAFRTDIRADIELKLDGWRAHLRWNGVRNRQFAQLLYLEGGYKNPWLGVFLRSGLFKIDCWDDRIYVYEHDVSGYYNSVAYYGRGWNLSLTASLKFGRALNGPKHRVQMRLGTIQYPWTPDKSPKYEWRLQYLIDY